MKFGHTCALAAATIFGMISLSGPATTAPLGSPSSGAERAAAEDASGSVHLVKKGRPNFRPGKRWKSSKWRYHGHKVFRGHRFRHGGHWYFWAPWVGSYLYFGNYNSCYNTCRSRGYSQYYCTDLCSAW